MHKLLLCLTDKMLIMQYHVRIQTADMYSLAATVFSPKVTPKAGVIINSATAVKRGFYDKFATYLADHGFVVVTYDYRGIGDSKTTDTRDPALTMQAWGERDLSAVIEWGEQHLALSNWSCIGHSVGGQIVGLSPRSKVFRNVYCVAAQSGYWQHWEGVGKLRMWLMWHCIVPILAKVLGRIPGWLLGGESLPKNVALQWAFWGRHKDYIVDECSQPLRTGFAAIDVHMHFLALDDDKDFAPPKAVKALSRCYTNATISMDHIRTKDISDAPIGHFGFFKSRYQQALWQPVLTWLETSHECIHSSIDTEEVNR